MIKNYFVLSWRNLLRNKVFSFINITGLSLGLACCMIIILYSKDELSFDRFHANSNHIYRITNSTIEPNGKVQNTSGITGMLPGPVFQSEIPEIKEFLRLQGDLLSVKVGAKIFEQEVTYVDDNFFSFFSFPLKEGNINTALKDLYSVVLNEELAKKFFGTSSAIGKIIELPTGEDGAFQNFTVNGIVPKSPQNSSIKVNILLPINLNFRDGKADNQWISFYLNTFVNLYPDADIEKVEAKFKVVYESKAEDQIKEAKDKYNINETFRYGLQPLLDLHLSTDFSVANGLVDGSNPIYTKILGAIALFMLVIACINFVNLTVARSLKRAKEIGIRKVIGGERKQLIYQFLGESFVVTFLSFVLAVLLVILFLPFFNMLSNKELSFSYLLDVKLILGYISLFFFTALLAGFYPALVLSNFNPVQTLNNRIPLLGKNYLAKILVVFQFTLTTILIIGTVIIYLQYNYLKNFKLGYNDSNLVVVNINQVKFNNLEVLRSELMKNSNVEAMTPRQSGNWLTVAKVNDEEIEFEIYIVDSTFVTVLEIPIVSGRNFSSAYPSDNVNSVLVNEAFMKKAGWNDLNNRQVDFFYDSIKYNVIGVIKDYHYQSLMQDVKPQLFCMNPKYNYGQLLIRIKPEQTASTIKHIEKVVKTQQPFKPFIYDFKDELNLKQYASDAKWKKIISSAAILTIFISCIGLFGLTTLSAEKRIKEIGIRKVLGASVVSIVSTLANSFLKLILISTFLSFPIAWWLVHKWIQNYPYRIDINIWIFILAGTFVLFVSMLTIGMQAIKSALANPIKSLRTE